MNCDITPGMLVQITPNDRGKLLSIDAIIQDEVRKLHSVPCTSVSLVISVKLASSIYDIDRVLVLVPSLGVAGWCSMKHHAFTII